MKWYNVHFITKIDAWIEIWEVFILSLSLLQHCSYGFNLFSIIHSILIFICINDCRIWLSSNFFFGNSGRISIKNNPIGWKIVFYIVQTFPSYRYDKLMLILNKKSKSLIMIKYYYKFFWLWYYSRLEVFKLFDILQ